jgi:phosphate transport system substrate-binding protein
MNMKIASVVASVALIASSVTSAASSRDYIEVVGSSTVYPFATSVAEKFGKATEFKTPKIESTGSGGGMKLFCKGVGTGTPDVTNSSRRIKKGEFDKCQANGVTDIVEVLIGFDGIAFANSKKSAQYQFTRKDIYLALAKDVPNPDGTETFVANPYTSWKQVNSALPDKKIEVLGPPPTSGTRAAFAE